MNVRQDWGLKDSQDNDSFYEQGFIDGCMDDDMISNEEAGFMRGYFGAG